MYNRLALKYNLKKIRIDWFKSAYPWKKGRPDNGLCSIETLWALNLLAGKRDDLLLENYR